MWIENTFNPDHNHESASLSEIQFLRSKQQVPVTGKSQRVPAMERVGIRKFSILENVMQRSGGRERLWFQKKSLHSKSGVGGRAAGIETDCEGPLGYLTCLAIRDDDFFCRFNVGDENRFDTVFWSDGLSRRDYAIFGDVLVFDMTYRSNAYQATCDNGRGELSFQNYCVWSRPSIG